MLLDAARGFEDDIIMFATDGIATLKLLDLETGEVKRLGAWEGPIQKFMEMRKRGKIAVKADMSDDEKKLYKKSIAEVFRAGIFARSGVYAEIPRTLEGDRSAEGIGAANEIDQNKLLAPNSLTGKTRGFSGKKMPQAKRQEIEAYLNDPSIRAMLERSRIELIEKRILQGASADDISILTDGAWAEKIVRAWRDGEAAVMTPYRSFKSLGASLASKASFRLIGCWIDGVRLMHCDDAGSKRDTRHFTKEEPEKKVKRADRLFDTRPASIVDWSENGMQMSRPRQVDWIDQTTGDAQALIAEHEAFFAKFG